MRTLQDIGRGSEHPMMGVEIGYSVERKVVMARMGQGEEPLTFSPRAAREMVKNLGRIPGLKLPSGYEPNETEREWLIDALRKAADALEPPSP